MEKRNKESIDGSVKIICPRPEDLSVIVNNVKCEECGSSFSNEPRLRMHVLKIHERKNLKKNDKEETRYHCPESTCVYALQSSRYFTTMKYLKQHYLKVHAAKKFPCQTCDKSFSTEAAKIAHLRICGLEFTCDCLKTFGTYEALLTHCKRTSHVVDEKYKNILARKPREKGSPVWNSIKTRFPRARKLVSILPHRTCDRSISATPVKICFDVGVQTDELKRQKRAGSPSKSQKRRESRQTQTSLSPKEKRSRKTVETQTARNSCGTKEKKKKDKSSFAKDLNFPENLSSENIFSSSTLELENDDVALDNFWEEKNTSLGTQTSPEKNFLEALSDSVTQTDLVTFYSANNANVSSLTDLVYIEDSTVVGNSCYPYNPNNGISRSDPMLTIDNFTDRFSSIETQTEGAVKSRSEFFDPGIPILTIDNFNDRFSSIETQTEGAVKSRQEFFTSVSSVERNFALSSNNETQTTENFSDDMERLLYSTTCTQTCNDILPSDLGLSNIQTQTAWSELEDAMISAETQTGMTFRHNSSCAISSSCRSWLNTRFNDTETQTDILNFFDEFS